MLREKILTLRHVGCSQGREGEERADMSISVCMRSCMRVKSRDELSAKRLQNAFQAEAISSYVILAITVSHLTIKAMT